MSFAVCLDSAPASLRRRFRAWLGGFALVCGGAALVGSDPSSRVWIAVAMLVSIGVACVLERRAGAPACGQLRIDDAGNATWVAAGGAGRETRIERWNLFGALAWLRLRIEGEARPRDVWVVVGDDDRRRRLRTWLRWYERGAQ